ncbi:CLUMA_CG001351, isoform A [Clunio marinus]|uniref:riboflavin kinase n=1 Tax=Clunio marinus TaxID=568069 RepID=A0A1J1HJ14_9DIPT|nr:CLUMA_CG001351, isoform A [Clunio marinus]
MKSVIQVIKGLPHFASGPIIKGFGRGSRDLANFGIDVVNELPRELGTGIYYGWASVDNGDVHKMVMSIGWNPYYENEHKSMETHILHNYDRDLYGSLLKVCIVGYLRPEQNFESLEALITAIKNDIADAERLLETPEHLKTKNNDFFKETNEKSSKPDSKNTSNGHHTSNGH